MLRSLLPFLAFCAFTASFAQECGTGRYTNYAYFTTIDSIAGVPFGSNTNLNGDDQVLRMDVYEPTGDALQARPVVLVAYGGSFVSGTRADVAPFCQVLAHLGYVAVAMDYRVGFFLPNESTTEHAVMRCVHDIKGCIRFLRKSVAENGNPYHIDQDRIIVGGVSAGAIGALHLTYMDQPSEMPAVLVADSAAYGGMEGNSGSPGYSSDVIGCFSLSGAIGDTTWIQPGDQPLCAIHENADPVVPCYTEEAYAFGIPTGITVSGGYDIHQRMTHIGVPDCFLLYQADQHVGYLTYDPVYSTDLLVQFLGRLVCGQEPGCPSLLNAVPELGAQAQLLKVYPSFTASSTTVELPVQATVIVCDVQGREVMRTLLTAGKNMLDLSSLRDGVYLLRTEGMAPRVARIVKG